MLNLFDEVSLEGGVSAGSVRKTHGNDVGQSLSLMDDGFDVRQVFPVFNPHMTVPHHPAELLLDPICLDMGRKISILPLLSEKIHRVCFGTLNMRVLGDKEEAPLQGVRCGVRTCCKQVQCGMKKVVVVIVEIVDVSVLNTKK